MWLLKELEVSRIRENLVTVDVFLYDRKFRVREAKKMYLKLCIISNPVAVDDSGNTDNQLP